MKFMPSRCFDRMSALLPALALALTALFVGTPGVARSQSPPLSDPPPQAPSMVHPLVLTVHPLGKEALVPPSLAHTE